MGNLVWLASYPKSGNTWMRAFLYNYIEQPEQPGRLNALPDYFEDESKPRWYQSYFPDQDLASVADQDLLAARPQAHQDIAASRAGSIFTKTHNFAGDFNGVPLHNFHVTAGAIYITRNPLDVVFSVADHFGLDMDGAMDFMADSDTGSPTNEANVAAYYGSWSMHVKSWTHQSHARVLVLRYEDMLHQPLRAFGQVVKLLNLPRSSRRLKMAIRFSSFTELRRQEQADGFAERSPNSERFFRRGQANQWRGRLQDEQVLRMLDDHGEQMRRFDYIPPQYRNCRPANTTSAGQG